MKERDKERERETGIVITQRQVNAMCVRVNDVDEHGLPIID